MASNVENIRRILISYCKRNGGVIHGTSSCKLSSDVEITIDIAFGDKVAILILTDDVSIALPINDDCVCVLDRERNKIYCKSPIYDISQSIIISDNIMFIMMGKISDKMEHRGGVVSIPLNDNSHYVNLDNDEYTGPFSLK